MELSDSSVESVDVSAYTILTDAPEGDGTLRWDSTTLIVCEVHAASQVGLGYTYGNQATAFVADHLAVKCLLHQTAFDIPGLYTSMLTQVRNDGSRGIASMAISALDVALWDLKAKLLERSIIDLLGAAHTGVRAYGSGGFTTYSNQQLASQLSGWIADGLKKVKMKIGAEPSADLERIRLQIVQRDAPRRSPNPPPQAQVCRPRSATLRHLDRSRPHPDLIFLSVPWCLAPATVLGSGSPLLLPHHGLSAWAQANKMKNCLSQIDAVCRANR